MKKILGIAITVTGISASPMSYDFNIYGTATSGFWKHDYYTNRFGNLVTHTGKDYQLGDNYAHVKINSYGYGKVIGITPKLGAVSIQHLMNNGKYIQVNLLHMHRNTIKVNIDDYISKNHYLGNEGNTGSGFINPDTNTHLHLEVAKQTSLAWVETARACPGKPEKSGKSGNGCTTNERTTIFDIGNLQAHYKTKSSTEKNIPFEGRVWYNPNTFSSNYEELLPFLSKSDTPSYGNFDVYGIANKTIYGYLNIGADNINKVGILVRSSKKRSDTENSNTTYKAQKFLAESTSDFIGLSGNSDKYSKGDYLFVPYVSDDGQHRYGYPLKFSFLDKGSFIIDNDKNNVTYDNGASYSEYLSKTNADEQNHVPGYFLTSRLIKVTSSNYNDYIKWSVPSDTNGKYHIYAHIPNGATAEDTTYMIRTSDGDRTKDINQSEATKEDWVDLGTYSLNSDSYVKLSLRNEEDDQWMAFDAIKFEKVSGPYNGTGSIIEPSKKAIGGNQDIVALQAGDNSMGSFQWYQKNGDCPHLLIKNDNDTNEVNEVLVVRKNWSNSAILSSFETSLPFSLSSEQNDKYDTILIKSLSPLTKKNEIRAICSDNTSFAFRNLTTNPNFITENGYTWTGNGSIISKELTGTGIGKTKDIAYKGRDKKSLTIFQWQPSDRCKKLKISGAAYYNQGFHSGYGFSGKLSRKIWNSNTYDNDKTPINFPYTLSGVSGAFYMIEIRTEGDSSSYPYIYAECKE